MNRIFVLVAMVISCMSFAQQTSPKPENLASTTSSNEEVSGRVGINTDTPLATLDIREVNAESLTDGASPQGVIFPTFTTDERNMFKGVKEGTMIYNKTLKCIELYDGTSWRCLK